jgi:hypothetical protein
VKSDDGEDPIGDLADLLLEDETAHAEETHVEESPC